MNYIIITPAYNEEKYIRFTLDSVVKQSILPKEWIIVNDGSTDDTEKIVKEYLEKYYWIKLINNKSQHARSCGSKVIRAFNIGYNNIDYNEFDFIVKLDADLTLPANYFQEVSKTFLNNPKIGLCGGYCVNKKNNKLIKEESPNYHIRGAFKSIRKECWTDIGGFKEVLGWDGLDEMTAMFKGWETKNLNLAVIHHRPTASAYNRFALAKNHGIANYRNGGNVPLAFIRSCVRVFQKPYFIIGIGFLIGYFEAFLKKYNKYVDKDLAKFINNFHMKRILNKFKIL